MKLRTDIVNWLDANGWKGNRFGHYQKEMNGNTYRMKVQQTSLRYEVKSGTGWVRLRSGYFKDLSITSDGKLSGLKRGY